MTASRHQPAADVVLRSGPAAVSISNTHGGRLTSLRVGDLELLGGGLDNLYGWGCYPMAPFAGRIRDGNFTWQGHRYQLPRSSYSHAIHGTTLDRVWQVLDVGATDATLRCDFDTRWPWRGHAVHHVAITDHRLELRLEVHADGAGLHPAAGPASAGQPATMPAWCGYHPWFARRLSRGEPVQFTVPSSGMFAATSPGLPTGEVTPVSPGPWDDTFVDVAWPATLTWPGAIELSLDADTRYGVVFDRMPDAVCVEPQTAPPNAVELGLAPALAPGESLSMTMSLTWHDA